MQKFRFRNRERQIKNSKIFLQKMLHRKKNSYFKENLVQNSKNPKEFEISLKSLGLNAKRRE